MTQRAVSTQDSNMRPSGVLSSAAQPLNQQRHSDSFFFVELVEEDIRLGTNFNVSKFKEVGRHFKKIISRS